MTPRVKEAIEWLREAEELLDQVLSNLRGTGLDQTQSDGYRKVNARQLHSDLESLIKNIETEAKEV